jgi:hypothetical protein
MVLARLVPLSLAIGLLWPTVVLPQSQTNSSSKIVPVEHSPQKQVLPCHQGTNFEAENYTIKNVTVDDPFKFLYWIGGKSNNVETRLHQSLEGKLFSYQLAGRDALTLIENAQFIPDSKDSFAIRVEFVSVQNCNPEAKTLDVIYRIYSTAPPKILGGATETQDIAQSSPQTVTGLTKGGSSFHLSPTGGYNRSYNIFGGGRFDFTPKLDKFHLFDSLTLNGQASSSMHSASAALSGSAIFASWLRQAEWSLNYNNESLPAGTTRLGTAGLSAQIDAETRPFWRALILARFGTLLQGGYMQSASLPADQIPLQSVANTGYGSWKSYVGLSSRTKYNVLSISYGLELGSVRRYCR